MAFGSFAMHGNPGEGKYHELTGSIDSAQFPVPENQTHLYMPYDTAMFDRVSMDVLFFVLFQATVRCMAEDPTDPGLTAVLGLLEDPDLAPLNCNNMYCDSREITHTYQKALLADTDQWYLAHDLRKAVPWHELQQNSTHPKCVQRNLLGLSCPMPGVVRRDMPGSRCGKRF